MDLIFWMILRLVPVKYPLLQLVGSPLKMLLFVLSDCDAMFHFHVNSHLVHNENLSADETSRLDGLLHIIAQLDPLHVVVGHVSLHHLPLHH